ncbi:hypothetical protein PVNG_06193 [Plasmodium vivax North Korean]|uniref:Uncharacterized protein n=1 Tax=Plasmodium vivax North Korean TaxID=1035514 RepID=A0A0J9W738_PLAVI|nr:hypothetical protein PVNG_06193 [Plasmodium vivax North Korean]
MDRCSTYDFESVSKNINSVLHDDLGEKNDRCLELYTELIKVYTEIDSSFINHCNKSVKYLKYLEDYYEGNINAAKAIIYVYCWLYDNELHKEKYNNSRLNIYKKLLKEYPVIDSMSNIPTIFQTYLKNSIDENLKNLYELYYKFDKFINEKECKGSNCKCAEECYDSYNSYIKGCNKSDNVNFCNGLEKFRAQYNNYMSDGSKCNGNYKYLPPAISFGISVILIPLIATLIISSLLFVLYKVIILYTNVNITYFH